MKSAAARFKTRKLAVVRNRCFTRMAKHTAPFPKIPKTKMVEKRMRKTHFIVEVVRSLQASGEDELVELMFYCIKYELKISRQGTGL